MTKSVAGVSTQVTRGVCNTTSHPTGIGVTSGITTSPFIVNILGKGNLSDRNKQKSYATQTMSGIGTNNLSGISTSTKLVRTRYLRFKNSSNYTLINKGKSL